MHWTDMARAILAAGLAWYVLREKTDFQGAVRWALAGIAFAVLMMIGR